MGPRAAWSAHAPDVRSWLQSRRCVEPRRKADRLLGGAGWLGTRLLAGGGWDRKPRALDRSARANVPARIHTRWDTADILRERYPPVRPRRRQPDRRSPRGAAAARAAQ